ncbi:hypothetical protein TKK_0016269 [Trichogramma kaykai]
MDISNGYHYKNDGDGKKCPCTSFTCTNDTLPWRPVAEGRRDTGHEEADDHRHQHLFLQVSQAGPRLGQYQGYLQDLAKLRNLNLDEMRHKMQCCPLPQPLDANENQEALNE